MHLAILFLVTFVAPCRSVAPQKRKLVKYKAPRRKRTPHVWFRHKLPSFVRRDM